MPPCPRRIPRRREIKGLGGASGRPFAIVVAAAWALPPVIQADRKVVQQHAALVMARRDDAEGLVGPAYGRFQVIVVPGWRAPAFGQAEGQGVQVHRLVEATVPGQLHGLRYVPDGALKILFP